MHSQGAGRGRLDLESTHPGARVRTNTRLIGWGIAAELTRRYPLVLLACAGLVMQVGWVLLWPTSQVLSASPEASRTDVLGVPGIGQLWNGLLILLRVPPAWSVDGLPREVASAWLADVFLLVGAGYVSALLLLDRGLAARPGAGRLIAMCAILFQITLLLMPGLFTTDIFSYLAYGRIAAVYGQNPYVFPPSGFPDDPVVGWISAVNRSVLSPYGPVATGLGWAVAQTGQVLRISLSGQVLAYRLIANAAQLANLGLVWWLVGRLGPGRTSRQARLTGFALFAWNPLVLFEVAGNGHLDGLAAAPLLLGVAALAYNAARRTSNLPNLGWAAASIAIGVAVLVKYTAAVADLLLFVAWARQLPSWRARFGWLGGTSVLLLGMAFVFFWPWLKLPDILWPMVGEVSTASGLGQEPGEWVPRVAAVLGKLGLDQAATNTLLFAVRTTLPRMVFVVYLLLEIRHLWTAAANGGRTAVEAVVSSSARASLLLLFLVPRELHAWYFVLPLSLVALLGWRDLLAKVTVGCYVAAYSPAFVPAAWSHTTTLLLYSLALFMALAIWAGTRLHVNENVRRVLSPKKWISSPK